MKDRLRAELKRIVEAVEVTSAESFTFAGRAFSLASAQQQAGEFAGGSHPLVALLEQTFYQHCYTHTFDGRLRDEQYHPAGEENLLPALSAANSSRERWDAGWQIYQTLPSGQILAHKNGLTRALWPGEFLSLDAPGLAPRPGLNISVFFMRESTVMQPGFYFAFGEAQGGGEDSSSLVRFYWNVRPEGAAELVGALTRRLNRFQVPFRLKCLTNSAYFKRHDTSVLFVNKRFYHVTSRLLSEVYREVSARLRAPTPLFTKRLADGLALAEEPYTGESFGMQRCRMLAEGVVSAHARNLRAPQARLEEVARQFERYAITLERPYLNPGSVDNYDFKPELRE